MFTLNFSTNNAAFEDEGEIPSILRKIATNIANDPWDDQDQAIMDSNGNKVGRWTLDEN